MPDVHLPDPEDRLRVCIVTDAYLPGVGGVENHVLHLAAWLESQGHDVTVVTHKVPNAKPRVVRQVESPVPVHRLPGLLLVFRDHDIALDPRMLFGFRRLLEQRDFDIVHGQSEASALVYGAMALARAHGLPTVMTRHSITEAKPRLVRPFIHVLTRSLSGSACGLIAVSEACAAEAREFKGPVRVIPNGVDTRAFRPMPEERLRLRRELGYEAQDVVIGFLGRLHRTKGALALLELFERARRRNGRAKLLFVGPGPVRPLLESRAAGDRAIKVLPARPYDSVAPVLNAMDVFAFPSRSEGFGISALEAMACGVPALAYARWGLKDVIADPETGFLVRDRNEFSQRLVEMVNDPGLRLRMGAAARQRAAGLFSWERVGAETVAFYRLLMTRA